MSQIEQQFKQAVMALQNGQAAQAKSALEKLNKKVKNSSAIAYNLGLANQYLQKHSSAVSCYEKALKLKPDFQDARINLAISLKELGQVQLALSHLSKINLSENARGLNLQAMLLALDGELETAQSVFEKAFALEPNNADIRFNLANHLRQRAKPEPALTLLQPLLTENAPLSYQCLQAELVLDLEDYETASHLIKRLVNEYPHERDVKKLHLQMLEVAKAAEEIVNVANELLKQDKNDAQVWNALGDGYFQLDNMQASLKAYQQAIKVQPENPEFWSNIGLVYASLGDKIESEKSYRHSLQLRPRHPEPYRSIAAMKRFQDVQDEDIQVMQSMWDDATLESGHRMKLAFALGKAYDDCALYEEAFSIYAQGNELKFAEITTDFDAFYAHIDQIPKVYSQAPKQVHLSQENDQARPIFIVGMPRSGTTLSEQIIARHPLVTACGELPCIEYAIAAIEQMTPIEVEQAQNPIQAQGQQTQAQAQAISHYRYPQNFASLDASILQQQSEKMMRYVMRHYEVKTPYFIDKMPTNFMHVGFIKSLFPQAKIINCRRHPLDVILSNYFQLFGSDLNFVYNLETLAQYYIRYHALSRHWQALFPQDFYQNDYEALVTHHEAEARKLIAAIGLPWDAACMDSSKALKQVRTASIWQVREGIYTRSKQRWKNYQTQLAPAIAILQEAGILDAHNNPQYG